jgi:predicted RNA-binding Zn ribbon-like protein
LAAATGSNRHGAEAMLVSAVGDDICLGFANTLTWRGSTAPVDTLADFAALLTWAQASVALPPPAARELASWAREHPSRAAQVFAEAIVLREAIYRIASALAGGEPIRGQDFAALSRAVAQAPMRRQLVRASVGYAWRIELGKVGRAGVSAATLLAPVLWSAADLMVGGARRRIRRCANDACLWLFVDVSKNGTRRWCDMASCGNRAKARRHYLKIKQG